MSLPGLPVSRLINVSVNLSPAGAQFNNLNSAIVIGSSDVIDTQQRLRAYAGAASVAADFGSNAPEYLAAVDFFANVPSPTQLYVGKWAYAATAGRLIGGAMSAAQQALTNFTGVTNGSLKLAIDGAGPTTITGMNFSAVTSMAAVAAIINTALAGPTCTWTGTALQIKSATTGAASSIGFPTAPASGTNIAPLLNLTAVLGARSVNGIAPESALAALQACEATTTYFYGVMFASANLVDADNEAIAAYVEADTTYPHVYGITTQNPAALDPTQATDIGSILSAASYRRSFVRYSSSDPYAVAYELGKLCTINWLGQNTAINFMYQQTPGLTPETLTLTQANTLDQKRINYSAFYGVGAAQVSVSQTGYCCGPVYLDEQIGADWLANYIQTNLFNFLATGTNGTKVPQTDAGEHLLGNNVAASCIQGVRNGLLAGGTWTAGGFGQLNTGDFLDKGYYVYVPPLSTQDATSRGLRKSVPIQVAAKLAGAVDTASVIVNLNR